MGMCMGTHFVGRADPALAIFGPAARAVRRAVSCTRRGLLPCVLHQGSNGNLLIKPFTIPTIRCSVPTADLASYDSGATSFVPIGRQLNVLQQIYWPHYIPMRLYSDPCRYHSCLCAGPHIDEASRVALDAPRFGYDGASSDSTRPVWPTHEAVQCMTQSTSYICETWNTGLGPPHWL
ncbi:hypothetical protein BDA96_04G152000 [Sorghum bicolor]|uniref:Uncharacterized protein n=1 Tax=Sorghum bicolor TaxID=4558 RepID=A0A921UI42_SORBI|nr:hypothetical protein BDA96_04G152000 [Sorghum bicolor]